MGRDSRSNLITPRGELSMPDYVAVKMQLRDVNAKK